MQHSAQSQACEVSACSWVRKLSPLSLSGLGRSSTKVAKPGQTKQRRAYLFDLFSAVVCVYVCFVVWWSPALLVPLSAGPPVCWLVHGPIVL